jgi:acetolactate synthase-1/3 small subunit
VTQANKPLLEQIEKQLRKLINVIKLRDMTDDRAVRREMALICVHSRPENRDEILRLVNLFRAKVIDVASNYYTIEASGDADKMTALIGLLRPMGIKKIARTGTVALYREPKRGI